MRKLTLDLAREIADDVIRRAEKSLNKDNGSVAVTVTGMNGKTIVTLAMDDVMPISVDLSFKKAYTAWASKMNTIEWEKKEIDPSNFADPNFTCFGGGVLLEHGGTIYGAIGVSGRCSYQKDSSTMSPLQDNELAILGKIFWKKRTSP
jgi:uncharacterized protein GlcG (DUF336 family)